MISAQHSSISAERYTPGYIIEPGRKALGGFDLDPASCAKANEVIQASEFYTAGDNGLDQHWEGRLLVNPPGTCKTSHFPGCGDILDDGRVRKTCSCNYVKHFWEKLLEHVDKGDVKAAVWIGFNCSQLQSLQQCEANPLHFLTCFVDHRVKYLDHELEPMSSPPHNSYVTLVAPPGSKYEDAFKKNYQDLGMVVRQA